jgi:hypothetical protein
MATPSSWRGATIVHLATSLGGWLRAEGAIDVPGVREAIERIMEGGKAAFNLRKEKVRFLMVVSIGKRSRSTSRFHKVDPLARPAKPVGL